MRLTQKKIREFGSMAILHKKNLYNDFVKAHEQINNQNTIAIKTIAEYNFFSGQEYAYLKILQYLQLNGERGLHDI